jgi:hypothetical protein
VPRTVTACVRSPEFGAALLSASSYGHSHSICLQRVYYFQSTQLEFATPDLYHSPHTIKQPSMSATELNSFPFLRLPAELRNRVYDFAIDNNDKTHGHMFRTHLVHMPSLPRKRQDEAARKSSIGLISTCQQIRSEFRPLFYRKWAAFVNFSDLLRFLDTFAPNNTSFPLLAHITVHLEDRDWDLQGWNLLPLLRAQKRILNTKWCFKPARDDSADQISPVSCTCDFLDYLRILSKLGFLDTVGLDTYTELYFVRPDEDCEVEASHSNDLSLYDGEWKLVFPTETGILGAEEKSKVVSHCKVLSGLLLIDLEIGQVRQGPNEVHVQVCDTTGIPRAAYVLEAGDVALVDATQTAATQEFPGQTSGQALVAQVAKSSSAGV